MSQNQPRHRPENAGQSERDGPRTARGESTTDVLQVSKFYYPYLGGIEQVVRTLAEGLNGPDRRMRVLAARQRGRGSTESIDGVRVRKSPSLGTPLSAPAAPLFPAELAAAGRDADLVHVHLPNPTAVVAGLLALPDDARLVVHYHSDIVKQSRALRLYRPLLHRFLERADRIVTTSPRLLEHSDHLAPYRANCEVIPLSIDVESFEGDADADTGESADLPVDSDRPVVLFVGRLNYYKGVQYLVDAMSGVDADLLIVGDGDRRNALERRAHERGVEDRVTFLGKTPDELLHRCYRRADVFALPSVAPSEAFGIVQLEAMAYGTPVVNTSLPTGVPWVSPDGETGLTVPPGDAAALSDALTRLVADPSLRAQYGRNARERVETEFDRSVMLDRTARLYDDVLGGR